MPDAAPPDSGPADPAPPPGIDVTRPNIARVYDYWLGGKDNFASDRELGDQMLALDPGFRDLVRGNRDFLYAAVTAAARDGGVSQFLDLGAGLPASPAIHDAARALLPAARFAYVDNDPVAALHTQAILAGSSGLAVVDADLADPASVLDHLATRSVLDLAAPAGIIFGSVGHFLPPAVMRDLVRDYLSRCADGSWLIISIGRAEDDEPEERLQPAYTAAQTYRYSPADFEALFAGTGIVPPGLCEARAWVAGKATPPPSKGLFMHCGVGIRGA
ncbi:MAG TPA: SAM-dependent methyltransferase [Trebonia sp.]|nr:SAM-dependent methyltransferase [Trebonia sp.]